MQRRGFCGSKEGGEIYTQAQGKIPFFLFLSFHVHETEKFRMNKCVDAKLWIIWIVLGHI